MKLIQYKTLSSGEASHLHHLNFGAAGHMSRGAKNRRSALIEKQDKISSHNFMVRIKNFCIKLSEGDFDITELEYLSGNLNLYKKGIDTIDYTVRYHETRYKAQVLRTFVQNNLPMKYLKLFHYNQHHIK